MERQRTGLFNYQHPVASERGEGQKIQLILSSKNLTVKENERRGKLHSNPTLNKLKQMKNKVLST